MPIIHNLTGQVFGKLTVIAYAGRATSSRNSVWKCHCACGKDVCVVGSKLTRGRTKSCGCSGSRSTIGQRTSTHGLSLTPEYRIWKGMLSRCYNPHIRTYKYYGGRGISVCPEWRQDFVAFLHSIGPRPSTLHSIERKNNDLGYCPDNCCWATREQQNRNRRPLRSC